jgi:hypothetical protein
VPTRRRSVAGPDGDIVRRASRAAKRRARLACFFAAVADSGRGTSFGPAIVLSGLSSKLTTAPVHAVRHEPVRSWAVRSPAGASDRDLWS